MATARELLEQFDAAAGVNPKTGKVSAKSLLAQFDAEYGDPDKAAAVLRPSSGPYTRQPSMIEQSISGVIPGNAADATAAPMDFAGAQAAGFLHTTPTLDVGPPTRTGGELAQGPEPGNLDFLGIGGKIWNEEKQRYEPYGKFHGLVQAISEGLGKKEIQNIVAKTGLVPKAEETGPVEGSSPLANVAGSFIGEGVKYGLLYELLAAAGVTGVGADALASGTSAAIRQGGSDKPSADDAALEVTLGLAIPGFLKALKEGVAAPEAARVALAEVNTPKTQISPVESVPATPAVPTGELTPKAAQTAAEAVPEVKIKPVQSKTVQEIEPPKPVEPPPAEPPVQTAAEGAQNKTIGLSKAESERLRTDLELDKLPDAERKSWETTLSDAKAAGTDKNALTLADEVLKTNRPITDQEHAGLVLKAADLVNEYDEVMADVTKALDAGDPAAAAVSRARADVLMDQLDKLTEATRLGRRETARALSIGRMQVNRDTYTLARVTQRAQAAKGAKLTPEESAKFEAAVTRNAELEIKVKLLEDQYDQMLAKREEEIARRVAEKEAVKSRIKAKAAGTRERIAVEREDIKKQLAAKGLQVYSGLPADQAYLVGKLAVTYIREGVSELEKVVKLVLADVPGISERDVWQALNTRDPQIQAKAANEATKRVARLKTQARLLTELDDAEKGIFKPSRTQGPTDFEIKALSRKLTELRQQAYRSGIHPDRLEKSLRTINELQDQLSGHYRNITTPKPKPMLPEEIANAQAKIAELRKQMRVEDDLADLNEQIRTGEYKLPEKKVPKTEPEDLERARLELSITRKKIRAEIENLAPMTPRKAVAEGVNTLRTLKATADISATFRQGLPLIARKPGEAVKASVTTIKNMFSEIGSEQIDQSIRSHPNQYLRDRAGLKLSDLGGPRSRGEEYFMSNLAERIPVWGEVVKASDRHMTNFLNLMRVATFDDFLAAYPNATRSELKAWADFVNVASGKGNLGKAGAIANELSLAVFAPRFAASRIQTPFMLMKYWKEPRVRTEIAKQLAATAGLGTTALTLASLAGAEVSGDPREADFGKIRFGDTRVDIWGGFQQPMRVIARIGQKGTDRIGLTKPDELMDDPTALELIGRFSAFKLAPSVTLPLELLEGKDIVGNAVTPGETAVKAFLPIMLEDIYDAYQQQGLGTAAASGALNLVGIGSSTYPESQLGTRKKIRDLANSGDVAGALAKRQEWNLANPNKRISLDLIQNVPKGDSSKEAELTAQIRSAVDSGVLAPDEAEDFIRDRRLAPVQRQFRSLSIFEAQAKWPDLSEADKAQVADLVMTKYSNWMDRATPAEREKFKADFDRLRDEVRMARTKYNGRESQ